MANLGFRNSLPFNLLLGKVPWAFSLPPHVDTTDPSSISFIKLLTTIPCLDYTINYQIPTKKTPFQRKRKKISDNPHFLSLPPAPKFDPPKSRPEKQRRIHPISNKDRPRINGVLENIRGGSTNEEETHDGARQRLARTFRFLIWLFRRSGNSHGSHVHGSLTTVVRRSTLHL